MLIADKECQVYRKKENGTQTLRSNYANTPKMLNYLYGLRGRRDSQQVILRAYLPKIKHSESSSTNKP